MRGLEDWAQAGICVGALAEHTEAMGERESWFSTEISNWRKKKRYAGGVGQTAEWNRHEDSADALMLFKLNVC